MAESRQHSYQLTRPNESCCQPCLRNGHQCMTSGHNGDEYICAFCEDGVACPVMKAAVKPSNGFRTTGIATALTNGVDHTHANGNGKAPQTVKHIQREGREAVAESRQSKRSGVMPDSSALKIEKERTMEKFCSVDGCGKKLRADNQSGKCTPHNKYVPKKKQWGTEAPKPNGVTLAPAPGNRKTAPAAVVPDGRVAIHLNESQVDNFFLSLTLSEKSQILNAHLAGGE